LLKQPPYRDPGRLVRVWSSMPERGLSQSLTSMPDYQVMRDQNRSLEGLGAYMQTTFNVTELENPERAPAARVSASLLGVLDVAPALGSRFTDNAERWGEHRLVLISEGLWRRRFGGSAAAVGRTLIIDEEPFTIVGVMPAAFRFPDARTELWTPLSCHWWTPPIVHPAGATEMSNRWEPNWYLLERYEADMGGLIVVYDDLALPLGKLRVRQKGSAGGHNGIKSIISALDSDDFLRVRVGIQPSREVGGVRDFALSRVAKGDRQLLDQTEDFATKAVETLIAFGVEKAMAEYNGLDLREETKDN